MTIKSYAVLNHRTRQSVWSKIKRGILAATIIDGHYDVDERIPWPMEAPGRRVRENLESMKNKHEKRGLK